ncbi:MAG TPA: 30S ribosomal protein S6 [Dehalococcoidia bacterium]|nr:30S ribosomal protein S6 [Dehalococcoidia bacterium]
MRQYELVLVLRPDLEDELIERTLERVGNAIRNTGGEVTQTDHWGRRRLAYPIDRQMEGYYVVEQLRLDGQQASSVEGSVRLTEEIMRHLLVRKDEA